MAVWIEDCVFAEFQDAKVAGYKTLVRRLSQQLRTKEDFKSSALYSHNIEDIRILVSQLNGPSGIQETRNATGAGSTNPFAGPRPGVGSAPTRGGMANRGAPRGGMTRGGSRFAAPLPQNINSIDVF